MTGVLFHPWGSDLPQDTPLKRLKRVATLVNRKTEDTVRDYVGLENLESWSGKFLFAQTEQAGEGPASLFEEGDVLFGKLRPYLAKVGLATSAGRCTSELLVLRTRELEPRFLQYALLAEPFIRSVDASTFGAKMPRADWDFVGRMFVPAPSRSQQRAVAAFLDRKTAAIDALIAKKERLVDLLQENRQALITHAVTNGLDPIVPMKQSRCEWLRTIPAHWTTSQPKHLCSLIVDGPHVKPDYVEEGIPFVTVKNLTNGPGIDFVDLNYISHSLHANLVRRGRPERGDVLLSKDGATLGVPRVVETDRVFSIFVSVALLKPRRHLVDSYFLRYVLEADSTWQQFKGGEAGSALKHIVLGTIGNVRIALPSLEEQRAIGAKLAELDARTDQALALVRRHVALLREYRQAIITAAVIGKIDLSSEAA